MTPADLSSCNREDASAPKQRIAWRCRRCLWTFDFFYSKSDWHAA